MKTPDEELLDAALSGDEPGVLSALDRGANIDATRAYQELIDRSVYQGTHSALMLAILGDHRGLARRLLSLGANANLANAFSGRTPLIEAASRGFLDVVEALISSGASLTSRDTYSDENALTAAIERGHLDVARVLARAGAPLDTRSLADACRRGQADLAALCIEYGLSADSAPALAAAAGSGRADMIRWLASAGANIAAHGASALHNAANAGHAEATRCLVELGVPVEARTKYGWTPLHLAAYNGNAETVAALLSAGADKTADDGTGKTPLDWARLAGKKENAALLG
jgi:ankyrin repeat protein